MAVAHLEHLVLQFDFLVPFLLWMQMDVVQVPVGGRGIHKSYFTLLPPLGLTLSEPGNPQHREDHPQCSDPVGKTETHLAMVSTPSFTRSRSLLNVCIFMIEAATGSVEKCWGRGGHAESPTTLQGNGQRDSNCSSLVLRSLQCKLRPAVSA